VLTLVNFENGPTAIEAAGAASAMGQNSFPALRTRAPLRLCQSVMRPALVFYSFRSSSLWYRHFDPILPAGKRQNPSSENWQLL